MISIFPSDYLKVFAQELKTQLAVEKKYAPISKTLVSLLHSIEPFVSNAGKEINKIDAEFKKKKALIESQYKDYIENANRGLKISLEKNESEIEKARKTLAHDQKALTIKLNDHLALMDEKKQSNKKSIQTAIREVELNYKRELGTIEKDIVKIKKDHQNVTTAIEKEKETNISFLNERFNQRLQAIAIDQDIYKEGILEKRQVLDESRKVSSLESDSNYLNIKNSYTSLSIQLNKKISELKKSHAQAIARVERHYQKQVQPLYQKIEELNQTYGETQVRLSLKYSEEIQEINQTFEQQKQAFHEKKAKITRESGEAVTLLNSKLSAYRETITRDKMLTSREMRSEMQTEKDVRARDKLSIALSRKLKLLDNDLNKQILRTQKDILEKHRLLQQALFQHEQNHLREIHDWRIKHALLEYEKKQELAKVDLNYQHNKTAYDYELKLAESEDEFQKQLLLLQRNIDLLPLEAQLLIASAIQDRELNLLANDAHQDIDDFKQKHNEYDYLLNLKSSQTEYDTKKAKFDFDADFQFLNTTIQLEIEKEKTKRDYLLLEAQLRQEMSKSLYEQAVEHIEYQHNAKNFELDVEHALLDIQFQSDMELSKDQYTDTYEKRQYLVKEAQYRTQHLLNQEKTMRLLRLYQLELNTNQEKSEVLDGILRLFSVNGSILRQSIVTLYELPSHPEVFKSILHILIQLYAEFESSLSLVVDYFRKIDQSFYMQKIDDITDYKYLFKYEDLMHVYDSKITKINLEKDDILHQIHDLESQVLALNTKLERHINQIKTLSKANQELRVKLDLDNSSKQTAMKENQKNISNHEHQIKEINQNLGRLDREIRKRHRLIIPFDREIKGFESKQQKEKIHLESKKHKEAFFFYRYLNKNQAVYQQLSTKIKENMTHHINFFQTLADKVYVTDAFLLQTIKFSQKRFSHYEQQVFDFHQTFLNLMLAFYLDNENEQLSIIKGFKRSTNVLITSLEKDYEKTITSLKIKQNKLKLDTDRQTKFQQGFLMKQLELAKLSHEKNLAAVSRRLHDVETRISQSRNQLSQEIKTLTDNQQAIATQFQNDHQLKLKSLSDEFKKATEALQLSHLQSVKQNEQSNASIESKNQVLMTRYNNQHQKIVTTTKQKHDGFISQMDKSKFLMKKQIRQYQSTVKRLIAKRESELHNIKDHYLKFSSDTKRKHNRKLNREVRDLKKSYTFKLRHLNLT